MYPRLPELDPHDPQPDETLQGYGIRILRFVVEHNTTATLDTRQLELADHIYPLAVAPQHLSEATLDRLRTARRLILATIDARKRQPETPPAERTPEPTTTEGGTRVPRPTPPIVRPPAPSFALDF